jgi:hypothetical protein
VPPALKDASCVIERRDMIGNTEFVSVRVAKVRAVVVLMILRTQPRRAFTGAAIVQRYLVGRTNGRPGGRCEGNHLPIAWMVWLSVKGLADDEEGARIARTVPTRPWSLSVTESQLNPQTAHHGIVEAQGALEIANADKDMGKHVYSSGDLDKRFSRPVLARLLPTNGRLA